ncbi:asparagine synthase (glutamine-hydrolyzing) [Bordetella sp. FB-8]|uniref:asparagine synthase (glutamine-hydrolyzing) n=1 Tax=Bordetella sp. FB-8 TaxID=1159870 RepID=UPI0003752FCE|nr:asparagine synthase (glutamine-hydrolyzing) [Bordetella sp. FB-8]
MCGIWISVGPQPSEKYLDIISHRGPDGHGLEVFNSPAGPVELGHRRLAIIDISDAGLQPMAFAEKRYWLVFNGEIYNYRELRDELAAKGHVFRTHSDSEVLLAAYSEWGEACLDRFLGMFAFAIFDRETQKLFLARDRFGIKPLYYACTHEGVAFASEIKQLLELPGLARRGNIARLYDFISSGMTDHTDETLFADVFQLRGGEKLTLSLASYRPGQPITPQRWYSVPVPGSIHLSAEAAAERFRELLDTSIGLHLRSDVPVGSCLSGGLDSSAIVSLASRRLANEADGKHTHTISACYAEKRVDERPFMESVVDRWSCEPHYVYPRYEDAFNLAEQITWHQDEPYGSTSIFAQWSVFSAAHSRGITVMLDGQGADEQLAGYHGGYQFYTNMLLAQRRYAELWKTVKERQRDHGLPMKDQLRTLFGPKLPRIVRAALSRAVAGTPASGPNWLDSEAFATLAPAQGAMQTALDRDGLPPVTDLGSWCQAMVQATNLPMLLKYEDRNSMAHSIEARVPFLDHRLVEFNLGLGNEHKMYAGETKSVLRRAMRGVMPDMICDRRDKLGFTTPEQEWFRGPLRNAILDGMEETLRRFPTLLNAQGTRQRVNDALDGRGEVDFTLWRIVNVGIWGKIFGVTI